MLIGLDVLLNADILYALRAMGHGDDVAIVDATFPAESHARKLIRSEGADLARMLKAVLSVLPIDRDAPDPIVAMQVIDKPAEILPIHTEIESLAAQHRAGSKLIRYERFQFYERVKRSFAVIATGDLRDYGNVILRKGDRF
jgi:L-fucose mutarotase